MAKDIIFIVKIIRLVDVVGRKATDFVKNAAERVYFGIETNANCNGVRGARIYFGDDAVFDADEFGKEDAIFELVNENFFDLNAKCQAKRAEEVVGERPRRLHFFELHGNSLRFVATNNNG